MLKNRKRHKLKGRL